MEKIALFKRDAGGAIEVILRGPEKHFPGAVLEKRQFFRIYIER
jgi:hypothetical protein